MSEYILKITLIDRQTRDVIDTIYFGAGEFVEIADFLVDNSFKQSEGSWFLRLANINPSSESGISNEFTKTIAYYMGKRNTHTVVDIQADIESLYGLRLVPIPEEKGPIVEPV